MSKLTIEKTLFLKAPPEHVWKFLTESEKLALWFHKAEENLKADSSYALLTNSLGKEGERLCWGNVIEFDPPNKLVHTFTHEYLNGKETMCTWVLTGVDGGTILHLKHSGFEIANEPFNEAADHDVGWDEHFIRLRRITL